MPRAPCCVKTEVKKGPWSVNEDRVLTSYVQNYGHANWRALPKQAGLLRCGKSCRLRWINYLNPNIKRGNFSHEEEEAIINLHHMLGNRWSAIAAKLPGRTDNEIKNVWHTHLKKRVSKKLEISSTTTKEEESDCFNESSSSSDSSYSETTNDHHHDNKSDSHDTLEAFSESFWVETLSEDDDKNNNSCNYDHGLMSLDDIEQLRLMMMENNGESSEELFCGSSDDIGMNYWYNVFLGKDNL